MPFAHDVTSDRSITLADGRTLGYSEFGDPDGFPILNNHGGLVCRLDVEPAHADARSLGVRIISPDRPGVATSDLKPDRDTLDWADDVGELLDALGIEELATMGWSMGGQYTLAVAHRFAGRVVATAVIAGCPPLDDGDTLAELNSMDRHFTHLSTSHPGEAREVFAALGRLEGHFPDRMAKLSTRRAAGSDRAATVDHADWMGTIMSMATTEPRGMVEEYRAWVRPWRFSPAEVPGPVAIWQGTADALVPAAWGQRLCGEIPDAVLHPVEGEGHLIGLTHRSEVMRDLLRSAGRA